MQSLLLNVISRVSKPRTFLASFMIVQPILVHFEKSVVWSSLTGLEHITHVVIFLTTQITYNI